MSISYCSKCQRENLGGGAYCVFCGALIAGDVELTQAGQMLRNELDKAKQHLQGLERRLDALEKVQVQKPIAEPQQSEVQPMPSQDELSPVSVEPQLLAQRQFTPPTPKATVPSQPQRSAEGWERMMPGNWLARVGIVALFIGLGFLTKLAFDNDWVGALGQLLIGILVGFVLLAGGEYWRKNYRVWSQTLTGGGVAVLFLSIFGSYALNDLMGFFPAFGLMFLVTMVAIGLSLRQESMTVAILGIIGAFIVPIILGAVGDSASTVNDEDSHSNLLLPYILLLDLGILGLVTLRPWRWMTLLGLVGSLILYGIWYTKFGDESSLLLAQSSLSGIFLVFMAATTIFHIQWRRLPEPVDLLLMSLNAATYFGISYALLWDDYRSWLGGFSIILAGLYLLLAYVAMLRSQKNEQLSLFAIGIAIVFLTIAVPVQLGSSWIAVAWAAEGAVFMWLASRLRLPQLRVFSIGVFVVLLGRLYFADAIVGQDDFRPILNDMVLAFVASIAALYIASYWLRRDKTVKETWLFPVMICAANVLTLWLVSAEIVNFIDSKIIDEQLDASTRYIRNLENVRSISLVALWALYGLGLVIMGIDKKIQWMRLGGYAVQILAVGIVLTQLNHAHAMVDRDNSTPIFNCSFAAFAISVTVLYISYYLLQKPKTEIHAEETKLLPAFVLVSNFLSLWVLSAEVVTFFGSGDAKSLSLTVLWAMYAFILIMVGITRQWRWVRLGGLVLVGVAGFKLFAIDTFTLESGYRVAAYLTLGVLLLAGGFAYQRFSNVIKRFFFE